MGIEGGYSAPYTRTNDVREERWLGGDLRMNMRRLLGPLDVHLSAGWRWIHQAVQLNDGPILERAGFDTKSTYQGIGIGPTLGLGYRYGLSHDFGFAIEASATTLFLSEGGRWTTRIEESLALGLLYDF